MQVGDEHGIDPARAIARRDGLDATKRTDPATGDWIGQETDPVEVDDDGGVAQEIEVDPATHRQPLRAASG